MGTKGYKVFESDWTCRGYQYTCPGVFEMEESPICCERGFHFCTNLKECFQYYNFEITHKVAVVEALGAVDVINSGTQYEKICTNKLHIIREISWEEALLILNDNKNYTKNFGWDNSGRGNFGHYNSGNLNQGDKNTGSFNQGNDNTGDDNCGNWNTGFYNYGHFNTGSCNNGSYNSGNYNIGDLNSGWFNYGNCHNGYFNTESEPLYIFNKPSTWTHADFQNSAARQILVNMPSSFTETFIPKDVMSQEEKSEHPEYIYTQGYLKHTTLSKSRQKWWNKPPRVSKNCILNLPNFDKEIFQEITGIKIVKDKY
jgi:hypothetical protein